MKALISELTLADVDLSSSTVTESADQFTVQSKRGGPRLILGALFGVPGVMLVSGAVGTPQLSSILPAILFCPVLFTLAALAGVAVSTKRLDVARRTFSHSLQFLAWSAQKQFSVPKDGYVNLKSENRGGRAIRYTIGIHENLGGGFVIFKDYFAARAFADRLSRFLGVPVTDQVPSALQLTKR